MLENEVQKFVRLALSKLGVKAFRNNCGTVQDPRSGNWIEYGVANPGGSDLIGWLPVKITRDMVGKTVAVFAAFECKRRSGGRGPTLDQARFIEAVQQAGGIAGVARSPEQAEAVVRDWRPR